MVDLRRCPTGSRPHVVVDTNRPVATLPDDLLAALQ